MSDCIFCKIIQREIPSYEIYRDNDFVAFLNIRPLNPGNVLVIPFDHYRWVWDVPNVGEYFVLVARIAKAIKKAYSIDYVVSLVFGEEVPHAHVWLVPRFPGDGHGGAIDLGNVKSLSEIEMKEVQGKLVEALINVNCIN